MIVKVFLIGKDRIFVEFDNNGKDNGFHIIENHSNFGKLVSKSIYLKIKKQTGFINYHVFCYSKYFENKTPQQIINI